jgi:hypothetical protein
MVASWREYLGLLQTVQGEDGRVAGKETQDADQRLREPGACVMMPQRRPARAAESPHPDVVVYRRNTVALLRRYFRMSIELGRLPSILGREFFRAKVTSYRMQSFEDVVILVHDVERCLERLDPASQQVVARVILQEHTYDEAAALMGWPRRRVARLVRDATDQLSAIFLETRLLEPLGFTNRRSRKSCQEGENAEIRRCA